MKVKRIVTHTVSDEPRAAQRFYKDVLGLEAVTDLEFVVTFGSREQMSAQISFASAGGSGGAPTPELSVEVDDLDEALSRVKEAKIAIEYGPVDEPRGFRRFFVRDPFGKLVSILAHVGSIPPTGYLRGGSRHDR